MTSRLFGTDTEVRYAAGAGAGAFIAGRT